jgi:hypothetical protein
LAEAEPLKVRLRVSLLEAVPSHPRIPFRLTCSPWHSGSPARKVYHP